MPFIWNDERCMWVDENDIYNAKEYVVVRKLFIEFKSKRPKKFDENFVRKRFIRYGHIESVEILNSSDDMDTTPKNKFEAYVTFVDSKSAYHVYTVYKKYPAEKNSLFRILFPNVKPQWYHPRKTQLFIIQPASTWHQPTPLTLDLLPDECLLQIFKFCDLRALAQLSETCNKFNHLLHQRVFLNWTKFDVDKQEKGYFSDKRPRKFYGPLAMVRKILRCIGGYINRLSIGWCTETNEIHMKRFFQLINTYVGGNIRELIISTRGYNLLTDTFMQEIRPVLSRLHKLEINVLSLIDLDLQSYCPDLVKLKLCSYSPLHTYRRPWPSLTRLSIQSESLRFDTLTDFLLLNPQIQKLKFISSEKGATEVESISKCLPNIGHLSIGISRDVQDEIGIEDFYPAGLRRLSNEHKQLTKLCLIEISTSEVKGVMASLHLFENLIELKLTFYPHQSTKEYIKVDVEVFTQIAKKLNQLETILFGFASVNEAVIVNCVRFCKSLKQFHVHDCELPPLHGLFKNIVNARKEQFSTRPLKFFVDDDEYISVVGSFKKDEQYYLSIHRGCDHSEIW